MNELALFAGAGGGLLASQWLKRWRTVCYVERERYAVEVLKARIRDGLLHDVPIWDDVRTFDGRPWRGCVDIISAGFPCQPFSTAGKRRANDDERNGWPDTIRIIREVQPTYVFLENVRGLLSAVDKSAAQPVPYFGTILRDLAISGYDARWKVLSAGELGAPHKRDRLWIVAHAVGSEWRANGTEWRPQKRDSVTAWNGIEGGVGSVDVANADNGCGIREGQAVCAGGKLAELCGEDVAYTTCRGCEGRRLSIRQGRPFQTTANPDGGGEDVLSDADGGEWKQQWPDGRMGREPCQKEVKRELASRGGWWAVEPELGRVADGVAHRVDRLTAIGNGQVPAVAATAWHLLTGCQLGAK